LAGGGLTAKGESFRLAEAGSLAMPLPPSSKLTRTDFLRVVSGSWTTLPDASEVSPAGDAPRGGLACFMADFRGEMDRGGGECLTVNLS